MLAKTVVFFAIDGELKGYVAISDEIKVLFFFLLFLFE
jgi:cation transport ATPase